MGREFSNSFSVWKSETITESITDRHGLVAGLHLKSWPYLKPHCRRSHAPLKMANKVANNRTCLNHLSVWHFNALPSDCLFDKKLIFNCAKPSSWSTTVSLFVCLSVYHKKTPKAKALRQAAGDAETQFELGAQDSSTKSVTKATCWIFFWPIYVSLWRFGGGWEGGKEKGEEVAERWNCKTGDSCETFDSVAALEISYACEHWLPVLKRLIPVQRGCL